MVEDLDVIVPNHEFNRVIEMIEDARARAYRAVNYQPLKELALTLDGIASIIRGWKFTSL